MPLSSAIAALARPSGGLAMLAVDQREALRAMIAEATGQPPSTGRRAPHRLQGRSCRTSLAIRVGPAGRSAVRLGRRRKPMAGTKTKPVRAQNPGTLGQRRHVAG